MKTSYPSILLQLILGIIIADIATGIGHWIEDTYLDYCIDIPILSDIAIDNELHHYFPRTLLSYNYLEHITYTLPITIFFLILLFLIQPSIFSNYPYFIVSLFIFSASANIFHRFSHMRDCENTWIVRTLQKCGVICSHAHHSLHHKISDQKYCSILEYTNHLLDSILLWRGLEYIVYTISGIKPVRRKTYDSYDEIQNHMHENVKLECPDKPTPEEVKELSKKLKEYMNCTLI